jgi:hypothetical protein
MEKKNVVKRGGNGIALTVALAAVLAVSSCKKEVQIKPEHGRSGIENSDLKSTLSSAGGSNYKVSQPISLNGAQDMTISGDLINGGGLSCINLVNCHNIHITHCKLVNSSKMGVNLSSCSNIIVDDCYVANVAIGVYSYGGRNISVMNNKMNNILDQQSGGAMVAFENLGSDVTEATSNSAMNNTQAQ